MTARALPKKHHVPHLSEPLIGGGRGIKMEKWELLAVGSTGGDRR